MNNLISIPDQFSKLSKEIYDNYKPLLIVSSVFGSAFLIGGLVVRKAYINESNGSVDEKAKRKNRKKFYLESKDLKRTLNQPIFKELFNNISITSDRVYLRSDCIKNKSKRRFSRSLSLNSKYAYQESLQIDKCIISSKKNIEKGLRILKDLKYRNKDVQALDNFDQIIENTKSLIDKIQSLVEHVQKENQNLVEQSQEFKSENITIQEDQDDDSIEFYDADEEPSKPLHHKLYRDSFEKINRLHLPRTDLSKRVNCESREFYAKVECLKDAFNQILMDKENLRFFVQIGECLIKVFVTTEEEQQKCLNIYREMIEFATNPDNHETIEQELKLRSIPVFNFYDLCLDYFILDLFQNLELVSTWMKELVDGSWIGFDKSKKAKEKRIKEFYHYSFENRRKMLKNQDGLFDCLNLQDSFFNRLYNLLEIIMPALALVIYGRDKELKRKYDLVKQAIMEVYIKLFNSNRIGYTNVDYLRTDVFLVFEKQYEKLTNQLQAKV